MTSGPASDARPSSAEPPTGAERPLLSMEDVELGPHAGFTVSRAGSLEQGGRSLVCVGRASVVLQATADPKLVRRGTLRLRGEQPARLLALGTAGYCPQVLPAPGDFTVFDALLGSVRLIGLGQDDVRRALDRTEAEGLAKRRLSDLGALEQRLVGLAHGLASEPELLLLEDPCAGLEDEAAELVLAVVERELPGRSWILGTDLGSPWARRLALEAEQALTAGGGSILGPVPPADLTSPGTWACFDQLPEALLRELESRGGEIVRTVSENVVLLRRVGGLAIADAAASQGACLLELLPLTPGD